MTVQIHGREVFNDSDISNPDIDGGTIDNTPIGTTTPAASAFTQSSWSKGSDVASANALVLGSDGNYFDITGVTAILSIGTIGIGTVVILHFDGILTLTHNATDLIMPSGANITTAAGDEAMFVEYDTDDWRCISYTRADGQALISPAASTTASGIVELAISSEIDAGASSTLANTPDALAGSIFGTKNIIVKALADDANVILADGNSHFTVPIELNGMDLVSVGAHVYTVSSAGLPTFQIHNLTDAVDMLSTEITIDVAENDSKDATNLPVIDTTKDDVVTGDVLRFDCDIAGTGTKGTEIRMGFRLP